MVDEEGEDVARIHPKALCVVRRKALVAGRREYGMRDSIRALVASTFSLVITIIETVLNSNCNVFCMRQRLVRNKVKCDICCITFLSPKLPASTAKRTPKQV